MKMKDLTPQQKLAEHAFDENWRVEKILHLGTMCFGEFENSWAFDEFIEDEPPCELNMDELVNDLPFLNYLLDDEKCFKPKCTDDLSQLSFRNNKLGFLVRARMQHYKNIKFNDDGEFTSADFEFGWLNWWFYADTFDECTTKIVQWVEKSNTDQINEAKKLQGIKS